jgi:serine/threonine-protein kinase
MPASEPPTPPPRREAVAVLDGKYHLIERAGEGGMATVWRAKMIGAAGFERTVAVKHMHRDLYDDLQYLSMFVEEARVGSQLTHENVVQVYDFCGNHDDGYYLVMEWVEGTSLYDLARHFAAAGELPPWDLVAYATIGTLRGLNAAHDRLDSEGYPCPIIHRDVTPSNVMCAVTGQVKLSDFGLARADDRSPVDLTQPGVVKGKLAYTSPEVLGGGQATELSDIYATGICLWEGLSGQRMFDPKQVVDTFTRITEGDTPSLYTVRDDLPVPLTRACTAALSTDPNERPASALDMAEQLTAALEQAPVKYFRDRLGEAVRRAKGTE